MRYVLARKGQRAISASVQNLAQAEESKGLQLKSTFGKFRENCEQSKERLVGLLEKKKKQGKRIIGYAATSKSTTVLNYCGIGPDLIEFISDTTPIKQGRFSPGVHIPVRPYEDFKENYPEYALLLAWNHKNEILEKESAFREAGGKWITFVPDVAEVQ